MKTTTMLISSLTVGVIMFASPLNAQQGDVSEGARVYGDTCGSCHYARSPLERTDRQWAVIINHMRVRANLTGGQTRNVLAFLMATNGDMNGGQESTASTVFSNDVSSDPAVIASGAELVTQKACVGCHVINGAGGAVGPDLDNIPDQRDAAFLRHKLTDPTFDNASSMMPNFGLSAQDIDALVAYLMSLHR